MNKNYKKFYRAFASFKKYDYELIENLDAYADCGKIPTSTDAINIINIVDIIQNELDDCAIKKLNMSIESVYLKYPLSKQEIEELMKNFKKNNLYETTKFIVEKEIMGPNTPVFTLAVINNFIFKTNSLFVCINSSNYKHLVISLSNVDSFNKFIERLIKDAKTHTFENPVLTIDENCKKLEDFPMNLKEFLKVEQIRMFGSYAKNAQTRNSDYDFLIITNDKNYDNELTRSLLGKCFEEKFGEHIDIVVLDINQGHLNSFELIILLQSKEIKKFGVI